MFISSIKSRTNQDHDELSELHVEMGGALISIILNYTTPTENILDWLVCIDWNLQLRIRKHVKRFVDPEEHVRADISV